MKIVYLGSGAFGLPTLVSIAREHQLLAVVTQPDRPAGRGGAMTPTPIAVWAAEHRPEIPIIKPLKVNLPEVVATIRAFNADAFVVIAFGQKLGKGLLEGVPAMNLHASLLPRWRGAAPINAAILAGDAVTGNSVITLADRMDAGLILAQSKREIQPTVTAGELHDLLAIDGPALVREVLARTARGDTNGQPQDESLVTIAPKMSKEDGWIDFAANADACRHRVHGLTPWPGVTVKMVIPTRTSVSTGTAAGSCGAATEQPLKILRVQTANESSQQAPRTGNSQRGLDEPGLIIDTEWGLVACGNRTALNLLEVQPPGKRGMAWADFARGRQLPPGTKLVGGRPT